MIITIVEGYHGYQEVSTNQVLAEAGWGHGLHAFVTTWNAIGDPYLPMKRMADTMEAIIGAVWLDSSRDRHAVRRAIDGLLGAQKMSAMLGRANPDYRPYRS